MTFYIQCEEELLDKIVVRTSNNQFSAVNVTPNTTKCDFDYIQLIFGNGKVRDVRDGNGKKYIFDSQSKVYTSPQKAKNGKVYLISEITEHSGWYYEVNEVGE